jgi:propanol-preferring alcohol dehydrogenase
MKAAYIADYKKPMQVDLKKKVPSDLKGYDILVQIKAAGMCHTDLQVLEGVYDDAGSFKGMVGSHEPAGVVVKLGSKAESEGLVKIGDRVTSINTYGYCGQCNACKHNGRQLCEKLPGLLGLTKDGGFAEYMVADARVVSKVPESIPFDEAAPLGCAGATVYGGIQAVGVEKDKWLAIVGIGGLGHLGVQYAKALGFKVVALDNRQVALDLLKELPSNLQPDKAMLLGDSTDKTIEALGSDFYDTNPGVDKAVICSEEKDLPRIVQQFVRKGGVICDVGLPADGPLEVDAFALSFKEQTIKGRLICTPKEAQDMVNLHAEHKCKTHIEKTYPIEDIAKVYEHYNSKELQGRICVVFD